MYGMVICLLLMLFVSFALPFTDIPVNVTDTVTKLYGECFKIFLHMTMYLHGNLNVTEIPSEMLKTASVCFNEYAHLCQQGTFKGYISTQQDNGSSLQGDITYDSGLTWRDFTAGSLTYQEAYCMIHVIMKMMNHSEVNLCSVLSKCSAAVNGTQCEAAYTSLLMTLQENCHWSSQDCHCEMVYTYTNTCISLIVVAVLCSIVALLVGGAYVHFKYCKKTYQCGECRECSWPHCSLPLHEPVEQQICTLSGSHHNRRIMSSADREFRSASSELASFLNQHQEYNCADISGDNVYETFDFRESLSEQQHQNIMENMEASNPDIPEYLEILPDYNDLEIPADHANQEQLGFDDPQNEYVMVGEIVRSIQSDRQAEPPEKEMVMVNEKFQTLRQQINMKNVVTKATKLEESDRLDKSSLFERLPFMQEIKDGEHVENMGSRSSLSDELVEIVIENGNHQFSENGASLGTGMRSLETPNEHF